MNCLISENIAKIDEKYQLMFSLTVLLANISVEACVFPQLKMRCYLRKTGKIFLNFKLGSQIFKMSNMTVRYRLYKTSHKFIPLCKSDILAGSTVYSARQKPELCHVCMEDTNILMPKERQFRVYFGS